MFAKRALIVCLVVSLAAVGNFHAFQPDVAPPAIEPPKVDAGEKTFTTKRFWRPVNHTPDGGHPVFFMDRKAMWGKDREIHFKLDPDAKRAVTLPIDWAKSLDFPMDLNNQYGDCYYAAGCHADNTWTGNAGTESFFSLAAIKTRYFALSGGDNGLYDSQMQGEMMNRYLADVPAAKIVSWANLDATDVAATQTAMQRYGAVIFTFAVASNWINNSNTGAIWDAANFRANNNGHAVIFNGCDTRGYYKLQTWGTYVWITPAGVRVCDPGAWVAFSVRWFNPLGYAPNGIHIAELAKQWKADTGKIIPDAVISAFPPAGPVPPPLPPTPPPVPPGPTPPPAPGDGNTVTWTVNGLTSSWELFPLGTREKLRELREIIGPIAP